MGYLAFDAIDEAIDATTAFLTPIDRSRWLRLLVVVFFIGGGGLNVPTIGGSPSGGGSGGGTPTLDQGTIALLVGLAAALVLLALAFAVVAAIMEFVLVESLRSDAVRIRQHVRRHWRAGLRLFAFRIGLLLLVVLLIGAPIAVAVFGLLGGGYSAGAAFSTAGVLLLLIPVAVVLFLGLALVNGFTTMFVVPTMLVADCGVVAGWRRFWRPLRSAWGEYLVYAAVNWLLHVGAGIAAGIVTLIGVLAISIPLGTAAFLVLFASGGTPGTPGIIAIVGIAAIWLLLVILIGLAVRVPVVTFFRYYALLILGDTDADLDLIPAQRAAVRSTDAG